MVTKVWAEFSRTGDQAGIVHRGDGLPWILRSTILPSIDIDWLIAYFDEILKRPFGETVKLGRQGIRFRLILHGKQEQ
jgi:hypothetical protein